MRRFLCSTLLFFIRANLGSIYFRNHFLREKLLQNFKIYRILSYLIVISCFKLLDIIVYLCVFVILGIKQIFIINHTLYVVFGLCMLEYVSIFVSVWWVWVCSQTQTNQQRIQVSDLKESKNPYKLIYIIIVYVMFFDLTFFS